MSQPALSAEDQEGLQAAIAQAKKGLGEGGIPIGSSIIHGGKVIGAGHNQRVQKGSVVLHGEMDCLEKTGRQKAKVYQESTIYSTLSPCPMCSGAIILYGFKRVVVGEDTTFQGPTQLLRDNGIEVIIVNDAECIGMMKDFIKNNPELWNEDIGV